MFLAAERLELEKSVSLPAGRDRCGQRIAKPIHGKRTMPAGSDAIAVGRRDAWKGPASPSSKSRTAPPTTGCSRIAQPSRRWASRTKRLVRSSAQRLQGAARELQCGRRRLHASGGTGVRNTTMHVRSLGSGLKPAKAVETLRECHLSCARHRCRCAGSQCGQGIRRGGRTLLPGSTGTSIRSSRRCRLFPSRRAWPCWRLSLAAIQDIAVFIMTFMVEFFRREREFARREQRNGEIDAEEIEAIRHILARADPDTTRRNGYVFRLPPERVAMMGVDAGSRDQGRDRGSCAAAA